MCSKRSLTHSSMASFAACKRRYFYSYELKLEKDRSSEPLRVGSAVHLGLDLLAQGRNIAEVEAHLRDEYSRLPAWCVDEESATAWAIECEVVVALVASYAARYADDEAEIIETEMEFEIPIINPITGGRATYVSLRGKIDKIIRLPDGRLAIREHKTVSEDLATDSVYWSRLRLDHQISTYVIAARAIGYDIATVEYDVIRKPNIDPLQIPVLDANGLKIVIDEGGERVFKKPGRPRQSGDKKLGYKLLQRDQSPQQYGERLVQDIASKPEWYFARREIPRLEMDLDEFRAELWQTHQIVSQCRSNGWWTRNSAACIAPYRCEFCDLCFSGTRVTDVAPQGYRFKTSQHQELGGANVRTATETAVAN